MQQRKRCFRDSTVIRWKVVSLMDWSETGKNRILFPCKSCMYWQYLYSIVLDKSLDKFMVHVWIHCSLMHFWQKKKIRTSKRRWWRTLLLCKHVNSSKILNCKIQRKSNQVHVKLWNKLHYNGTNCDAWFR